MKKNEKSVFPYKVYNIYIYIYIYIYMVKMWNHILVK